MIGLLAVAPVAAQFRYPPYPYYGAGYARYESELRIKVKPNNASVFVDGYFAGQVDDFDGVFQRLHMEPGQHEIVVYLPGYRSIRERLYFSPSSSRRLTGTLERLAPGEPEEAAPMPLNPPTPQDLRRGPTPYGPMPRRGVSPPPDRGPAPGGPGAPQSSRVGTLSLRVQPGDADVLVDGQRWTYESSNERLLIQLSEGRHTVEVSKNGYRRFSTEIQLRPGETAPLNVSLTPDR